MRKLTHLKDVSIVKGNVKIDLDLAKYNERLKSAQYALDSQIMNDMVPYMPHVTGNFVQRTRAESAALAGTGKVCAAVKPFGRYLYYGKVMVNEETGKGPLKIQNDPGSFILRYKKGTTLVETDRPLKYTNPNTEPEWFEVTKKKNMKDWISLAQNVLQTGNKP